MKQHILYHIVTIYTRYIIISKMILLMVIISDNRDLQQTSYMYFVKVGYLNNCVKNVTYFIIHYSQSSFFTKMIRFKISLRYKTKMKQNTSYVSLNVFLDPKN